MSTAHEKESARLRKIKWRLMNRAKERERQSAARKIKGSWRCRCKGFCKNKENDRVRQRATYAKAPHVNHARVAKRRASQLQRTPVWAELEKIQGFFTAAEIVSAVLNEPWHVDHIIPLQGKNVSGLHVYENLQILPGKENLRKRNKFEGANV